jgi:hypothetical protein
MVRVEELVQELDMELAEELVPVLVLDMELGE